MRWWMWIGVYVVGWIVMMLYASVRRAAAPEYGQEEWTKADWTLFGTLASLVWPVFVPFAVLLYFGPWWIGWRERRALKIGASLADARKQIETLQRENEDLRAQIPKSHSYRELER